jgi:hypothetical protein
MRASLPHPISRRRRAHRSRGGHRASPAHEPGVDTRRTDSDARPTDLATHGTYLATHETYLATQQTDIATQGPDLAAQRVRAAGGPTDLASYACQCGYLFTAAVSTSVGCPHCGTPQAW